MARKISFNPHNKVIIGFLERLGFCKNQISDGVLTESEIRSKGFTFEAISEFARTNTIYLFNKKKQIYENNTTQDLVIDEKEAQYGNKIINKFQNYKRISLEMAVSKLKQLTKGCWRGRTMLLYNLVLFHNNTNYLNRKPREIFTGSCNFDPDLPTWRHQFYKSSQVPINIRRISPAIVPFKDKNGHNSGSGIIVKYEGKYLLLTAEHVIQYRKPGYGRIVSYELHSGQRVPIRESDILNENKREDFAILTIPKKFHAILSKIRVPSINISWLPTSSRWVFAMGYPYSAFQLSGHLWISACNNYGLVNLFRGQSKVIRTNCELRTGQSGGALVDENGNIVGLNFRSRMGIYTLKSYHVWLGSAAFRSALLTITHSSNIIGPIDNSILRILDNLRIGRL